jgi:hypothetical protein
MRNNEGVDEVMLALEQMKPELLALRQQIADLGDSL